MPLRDAETIISELEGSANAARQAAEAILTRDDWLHLAAEGSQLGLWLWNETSQSLFWDAKTREIFGIPVDAEIGLDTFYQALHPDDRVRTTEVWRSNLETGVPYELEYRSKRPDGSVRWVSARGRGYYDSAGKPLYMVGVVFDITDEKESEKERAELSGRLIRAQEEERGRIARELHDDFSQRIALAQIQLSKVKLIGQDFPQLSEPLSELAANLAGIGADLRALSHSLHSSYFEARGLVPSARLHCEEFQKQYAIPVEFEPVDVSESIQVETALSVFRIMQEALANVGKHSNAANAQVRMEGTPGAISLTVTDDGVGIDLSANYMSNGIGIRSMKERARMLGGTFELVSSPARGTRIAVKLPGHA